MYLSGEDNTPQLCIERCQAKGFKYAGVQYATQCFCDDMDPPASRFADQEDCDHPCPGDKVQMCGAYLRMNVYFTGI